jgi:hypothetical protein
MPDKPLTLVPGVIEEAASFLADHAETRTRFDRVGDLVEGFETPYGLELLSTVHWVATQTASSVELDAVVRETHAWSDRKKRFTPRQIGIALGVLEEKGWLSSEAMA